MKSWMAWLSVRNNGMVMSGRYMNEPAWTPSEQFNQTLLEKERRNKATPCTLGSIISFNENYMDVVDWAYQKIGPFEILWAFGMLFLPLGGLRLPGSSCLIRCQTAYI
ncbi:hypothetical protein [Burkholderia sp. BCC1047]|uniref:hypothetical protein n=1 Tax=Burkholderia sp. BCC1047 TaxID=2676299 RepID=UPI00158EAFD7|nr:hypothetical protein [Burkholderia sp. BCC1047]